MLDYILITFKKLKYQVYVCYEDIFFYYHMITERAYHDVLGRIIMDVN